MRYAAQNHVVSDSLERCIVVPAVTEVCRPQSRHSCKRGRLFSPTARRLPQPGHTKPSGQRRLNKKAAQLFSSENDFWNSASDRALAISVRPRDRANPIAQILHLGEPESPGQASDKDSQFRKAPGSNRPRIGASARRARAFFLIEKLARDGVEDVPHQTFM